MSTGDDVVFGYNFGDSFDPSNAWTILELCF